MILDMNRQPSLRAALISLLLCVALIAVVTFLVACGSDVDDQADKLATQVEKTSNGQVKDVSCVWTEGREYQCVGTSDDGQKIPLKVIAEPGGEFLVVPQ